MTKAQILLHLELIKAHSNTGDYYGDLHFVRHRIDKLIEEMTNGRQSVESVREDGSKVFLLD